MSKYYSLQFGFGILLILSYLSGLETFYDWFIFLICGLPFVATSLHNFIEEIRGKNEN